MKMYLKYNVINIINGRGKMKYITIQRKKSINQALVTIPAHLDKELQENNVNVMSVKIEDGKLIYTPIVEVN